MDKIVTAFYIVGILSCLIIAHELGHFIAAKLCKMNVEDFSLFFGPRLFRIGKWGGTEFNVRSVPLGGFVKVSGMEPEDLVIGANLPRPSLANGKPVVLRGFTDEALSEIETKNLSDRVLVVAEGAVGADFRMTASGKTQIEELLATASLHPDERKYLQSLISADGYRPSPNDFNQKPLHQRAFMIFAGPLFSFVFGYLIFCVMGFTTGLPDTKPSKMSNQITSVMPGKPADRAGIKPGDRIVGINGKSVVDWEGIVAPIRENPKQPISLKIDRKGVPIDLVVTPDSIEGEVLVGAQKVKKMIGQIGISPDNRVFKKRSFLGSIQMGTEWTILYVTSTLDAFTKPKVLNDSSGGIIKISEVIHEDSKRGIANILLTSASLSLGLAIMNLIPIPLLDGGHLLLLAIEGIRRRKLTAKEVLTAYAFGASIIIVLFVWITYKDVMQVIVPMFKRKS